MIIPLDSKCRTRGAADNGQLKKSNYFKPPDGPLPNQEFTGAVVNRLTRIESILRNGLPTDDEAEASTIAHAHSEVELLLESLGSDGWAQ